MSSAGGPTVGVVLVGACWAWAAGMEYISEIFHFYFLGYPLRQRFLELGGPTHAKFGMMVGLSSVLDKFVFVFR